MYTNYQPPFVPITLQRNKDVIRRVAAAIRKNGVKQTIGTYKRYDISGKKIIAACAIGQAAINQRRSPDDVREQLNKASNYQNMLCPVRGHIKSSSLDEIVIHLNDSHKWNFTRIADWLDKVAAK